MSIGKRPFQTRFSSIFEAKLAALRIIRVSGREPNIEDKLIVADVHAGSGKTLAWLDAANRAFAAGDIQAVACYTPRLNLCQQAELDWEAVRKSYGPGAMGRVCHVDNDPPFLRHKDQIGIVSTYQSLVARPELHLDFVRAQPALLVADEAQMLGADEDGSTQSADAFQELAKYATIIVMLSGTPTRADGRPLVLARYSPPDATGRIKLLADVKAGYLEGVTEGYLRPLEAELIDAEGLLEDLVTGEQTELQVSTIEAGLVRVLKDVRFFGALLDRTVEKVRSLQEQWPDYCGLIAAFDQNHARAIMTYLNRNYPDIHAIIAVSDEKAAQDNLRKFKAGGYDLLVTVAMAHVGFDHKPISVVCCLNNVRDEGWCRQLFARGLRMANIGDPDLDAAQRLFAIVPDDPRMRVFMERMRTESDRGLLARPAAPASPVAASAPTAKPLVISSLAITSGHAVGLTSSVDADEFARIDAIRRKHKIASVPATALKAMLAEMSVPAAAGAAASTPAPTVTPASPLASTPAPTMKTAKEKEREMRAEISRLAKRADAVMGASAGRVAWGTTYIAIKRRFGGKPRTEADLRAALKWLVEEWLPTCSGIVISK